MRQVLIKSGIFLVAALFAFVLSGCDATAPTTDTKDTTETTETTDTTPTIVTEGEVVMGGIIPLTGDGAAYGKPLQTVTQIALDKFNSEGGVNGKALKIVWEDGKCSGTDAANAIQKLINIDKVNIVYGGFCSSETLNAAPISEQNKVILFSCGSSSPDVTNAGDYVFRNYPSDASQGKVLANLATDLGYKKVGMLSEENDYTVGIEKVFTEEFNGEIVSESYLPEDSDFRTQITKLKGAGVDMLFLNPQTAPKAELLVKQAGEAQVDIPLFGNDVVLGTPDLATTYKDVVEGMIGAEVGYKADDPEYKALVAAYTERTGDEDLPWDSYSATCYDAVFLLGDALKSAGTSDTDAIRDYLYGVKDRPGIAGSLTIDENGDPLAGHNPVIFKDGVKVPYTQ